MNNRDCPHGHKLGKCDTCELIEAEKRISLLEDRIAFKDRFIKELEAHRSLVDEAATAVSLSTKESGGSLTVVATEALATLYTLTTLRSGE